MLFDFFKRKGTVDDTNNQEHEIELPFDYLIVPGKKAVETCLQIRNDHNQNVTPVILGGNESIKMLSDNFDFNEQSQDEIIYKARDFKIEAFIKNRAEDYQEEFEFCTGEWPNEPVPQDQITAHTDVSSGKPLKEVYIGLIPTKTSYEIRH